MTISIDEFKRADIRVGTVLEAEPVPDTDKLLRLTVDLGEEKPRQILSGIAEYVEVGDLINRQLLFVTNLEPRVIRGLTSNGMLLATGSGDTFTLMGPLQEVQPGSSIT